MWTDHARARCIEFEVATPRQQFVGEHYGYERLADPVIHRRTISLDPAQQLIEVTDLLRCDGAHRVRRAWHFAEDCHVERRGNELRVSSGPTHVTLQPLEEPERVEVHRGGSAAQGGWISRSFGSKQPTTSVFWHSRIEGVTVLRTRISYTRSRTGAL